MYYFSQVLLLVFLSFIGTPAALADDSSGQEVKIDPSARPSEGETVSDEQGLPVTGVPQDSPGADRPPREKPRGKKPRPVPRAHEIDPS
jgi:hypothetical protein